LLAEDEKDVRSLIGGHLASLGYTVVEAGNGADALQLVADAPGFFDLLVTDIIMPKMGGQELAGKIREICPTIKSVQISGYNETTQEPSDEVVPQGRRLQKPFTLDTLDATVRQVLDHDQS
jgi:two-component system cell cycle sensor histidine kinase/response regulator CckA